LIGFKINFQLHSTVANATYPYSKPSLREIFKEIMAGMISGGTNDSIVNSHVYKWNVISCFLIFYIADKIGIGWFLAENGIAPQQHHQKYEVF